MAEQFGWAQLGPIWAQTGPAPLDIAWLYTHTHSHVWWVPAVGEATQGSGPCVPASSRPAWAPSHDAGVRVPENSKRASSGVQAVYKPVFVSSCYCLVGQSKSHVRAQTQGAEKYTVSPDKKIHTVTWKGARVWDGKNLLPFLLLNTHLLFLADLATVLEVIWRFGGCPFQKSDLNMLKIR